MRKRTLEAIKKYAIEQYPNEACGLIVASGKTEKFVPVSNSSAKPGEHFRIAAEEYARIEDEYTIMQVVHSHPDESAKPSEADRVICEASGLPWVIVSVYKDLISNEIISEEVVEMVPEGYEAPLIGRPFFHGVLDCYTLVQDHFQRNLGITLPNFPREDCWWEDPQAESLYLKHFAEAGFIEVTDGSMNPNDVILMEIASKAGPNHAGVFIGEGMMLHHMYDSPSSKAPYGGSYKYATRKVVRHKELANG